MQTLFVATGNAHKVEEIRSVLGTTFRVISQKDLGLYLEPEETGSTFAENARIKALTWARHLGSGSGVQAVDGVLADDSGLEVDVLGGAPGVHSARYAHLETGQPGNAPDAANNDRLLRELTRFPVARWTARFKCVLALAPVRPGVAGDVLESETRWFEGACEGRIQPLGSGVGGFGYDPLFVPEGETRSFAELGASVKNRISHRARALAALWDALGEG
jgi:XTP/dITP diphosphohydrolase